MILGRVPHGEASILDGHAWEFWAGTDESGDPRWSSDLNQADYILRRPGQTSMTGITYIESLDLYCMPQWYYLFEGDDPDSDWGTILNTVPTRVDFLVAKDLWEPWTPAYSFESAEGWYNPCILTKPMTDVGVDNLTVFVAGLNGLDEEHYRLNALELPLSELTG